jgi:hypothetical protein
MTLALGTGIRIKQGKKPKASVWDGKVLKIDHANVVTDASVKEALIEHIRYRGIEDYIDEVQSEEFIDTLFE